MRPAAWLLALCASCATLKDDKTVCAEYRDLRCAAATRCGLDRARGCQVCRCESVTGEVGPDGNPTVNSPPPGR
jgi:hypothetical protein